MGLIHQNRDYVSRARAAKMNLQLHKIFMDRRTAKGVERNLASKQALKLTLRIPYNKRSGVIKTHSGVIYVKASKRARAYTRQQIKEAKNKGR